MADYYAVLQRTLSGFTNPKPQLRTKLYERARTTIQRQLEGRTPPVSGDALTAELDKLEQAITSIEQGYDESHAEATTEAGSAVEPSPEPVAEALVEETSVTDHMPVFDPAADDAFEPVGAAADLSDDDVVAQTPDADAMKAFAEEFHSTQSGAGLPPAAELAETEQTAAPIRAPAEDPVYDPVPAPPLLPEEDIAAFDQGTDAALTIPAAPGNAENGSTQTRKRGIGKWIVMLFVLALLGAAATYSWKARVPLLEMIGMSDLIDDPTRPKRVKTIAITPDPEPAETEEPITPTTPEVKAPEPKTENRLSGDGVEINPVQPQPVIVDPTTEGSTTGDTATAAGDSAAITPAPATAVPAVAQNAILYEEGATQASNSVDAGRVVWSVVQESPAPGQPKEPAIRGRVEIPSRKTVLIMTIKRNGDRGLPASHLIELVFAVPDDFSGGAVDQINRFVLKESEQGRGEGLVGVPARIADGIFLVALNNLEEAQKKNEALMKTRDWIDIPMQYRTGRRALMTIEKGVPGEKVFTEVFDAWAKL